MAGIKLGKNMLKSKVLRSRELRQADQIPLNRRRQAQPAHAPTR
jgi:hypothetical protein